MLHHVVEYAKKHVKDSEPGFTKRPIHWRLRISPDGRYINVEPYGERKKGRQREERCPDMPNMRAGKAAKRAHFLVETALAAALYVNDEKSDFKALNDDKAVRRNAFFIKLLHEAAQSIASIQPVAEFFASENEIERLRQALGTNGATANDWIMCFVDSFNPVDDPVVLNWWRSWLAQDVPARAARSKVAKTRRQEIDLISGDLIDPRDRHPPVKGLADVGGNQSGTPLVCFDKQAFSSFGLRQGGNAAMSAINAQLYADGLTHILKASQQIAGARVAYWFGNEVPREDDPFALLAGMYTEEQREAGALASVRDLLKSIEEGKKPGLLHNQFFAITLSGAAGRAMVRDWMESDFKELVANIGHWFSDMEVVAVSGKRSAPDQKFETVVTSLLAEKKPRQKYTDWVKPIGPTRRQLLHAAVKHLEIPSLVLGRLVTLLPAFFISDEVQKGLFRKGNGSETDASGLIVSRLYARMGSLKAYFIRGGDFNMTAYLNDNHPSPAYHCGRLMAVLAELQYAALGDVGAGVVQRYYAAASQMPGLTLGRLVRNAQNHLSKPDKPWLASKFETPMMQISGKLKDRFPRILDLEGQGLFALGYYQQLAALRAGGKNSDSNETATNQGENA